MAFSAAPIGGSPALSGNTVRLEPSSLSLVAMPTNPRSESRMADLNWSGLIPIGCGIYGFLIAVSVVPRNPTEPEQMELWRRKFGKPN